LVMRLLFAFCHSSRERVLMCYQRFFGFLYTEGHVGDMSNVGKECLTVNAKELHLIYQFCLLHVLLPEGWVRY
jgi:hypothetical protein